MPLILGRSGTQYFIMVTKLLSSFFGAPLVESYCKESNISDANWLRYLFSSYMSKIRLRIRRHHLANKMVSVGKVQFNLLPREDSVNAYGFHLGEMKANRTKMMARHVVKLVKFKWCVLRIFFKLSSKMFFVLCNSNTGH